MMMEGFPLSAAQAPPANPAPTASLPCPADFAEGAWIIQRCTRKSDNTTWPRLRLYEDFPTREGVMPRLAAAKTLDRIQREYPDSEFRAHRLFPLETAIARLGRRAAFYDLESARAARGSAEQSSLERMASWYRDAQYVLLIMIFPPDSNDPGGSTKGA